jgi:hypothetical protein
LFAPLISRNEDLGYLYIQKEEGKVKVLGQMKSGTIVEKRGALIKDLP